LLYIVGHRLELIASRSCARPSNSWRMSGGAPNHHFNRTAPRPSLA